MSFTLYFQAHEHGSDQNVPVQTILDAFAPHITHKDEFGVGVEFDELNSSFIYIKHQKLSCNGFSVARPCGDERLYQAFFKIAEQGNFICLTPEGLGYIFNPETAKHLPIEMQDAIKLKEVRSPQEFINTLENS